MSNDKTYYSVAPRFLVKPTIEEPTPGPPNNNYWTELHYWNSHLENLPRIPIADTLTDLPLNKWFGKDEWREQCKGIYFVNGQERWVSIDEETYARLPDEERCIVVYPVEQVKIWKHHVSEHFITEGGDVPEGDPYNGPAAGATVFTDYKKMIEILKEDGRKWHVCECMVNPAHLIDLGDGKAIIVKPYGSISGFHPLEFPVEQASQPKKIRIAAIIKHPGRDNDWRIDIFEADDSWAGAEIMEQLKREMLGPFEVIALTTTINENRKFPYLPRIGLNHEWSDSSTNKH